MAMLNRVRKRLRSRGALILPGGAIGIVAALLLLHPVDARTLQIGFGAALAACVAYVLLGPAMTVALGVLRRWLSPQS